jgi:adenosylcobinamide-phosphate synthase
LVYSLIVILIVLLADHFLPDRKGFNPFSWFRDWVDSVEQRFNGGQPRQGLAALGLTVGSVFLVVILLQLLLAGMNWFLRLGFDIALMYFFIQVSSRLLAAKRVVQTIEDDDISGAEEALAGIPPVVDEPVTDANPIWIGSMRLLVGADSWFFAPVFWFVIFGPAGAVLHYTTSIAAQAWDWRNSRYQEFGRAAHNLHQVLTWIPVRILAISYALLGDFEGVLQAREKQRDTWTGSSNQLLVSVGLGALGQDYEAQSPDSSLLRRTVALEYRVVIFWAVCGLLAAVVGFVPA